jgi:hypothetical protein
MDGMATDEQCSNLEGGRVMNRLEQKLKWLAESPEEKDVNWQERKEAWKRRVSQLYDVVESWLKVYADKRYLSTQRSKMHLSEELLGDYEIETLKIYAGDSTVIFEPYAHSVIGAHGRIDLYLRGYKSDRLLLILTEPTDDRLEWEVWKGRDFGFRKRFTKEVLEDILYGWL